MVKVKMLRDSTDYKTGSALQVDEVYKLDRTEEELIMGVAGGIWVSVEDVATEDVAEEVPTLGKGKK